MILSKKRLDSDALVVKFEHKFENTVCSLSLSNQKLLNVLRKAEPHVDTVIAQFDTCMLKLAKHARQHYDVVLHDLETDTIRGAVTFKEGMVVDKYANMSKMKHLVASTATASLAACEREAVKTCLSLHTRTQEDNDDVQALCVPGKYQSLKENKTLYSQMQSNMPSHMPFANTQVCMMTALMTAVGLNSAACNQSLIIINNSRVMTMGMDFWKALQSLEPSKRRATIVVKADGNTCKRFNLAVRWCDHITLPSELQSALNVPNVNREWCFLSGLQNNTAVAIAPTLTSEISKTSLMKFFADSRQD